MGIIGAIANGIVQANGVKPGQGPSNNYGFSGSSGPVRVETETRTDANGNTHVTNNYYSQDPQYQNQRGRGSYGGYGNQYGNQGNGKQRQDLIGLAIGAGVEIYQDQKEKSAKRKEMARQASESVDKQEMHDRVAEHSAAAASHSQYPTAQAEKAEMRQKLQDPETGLSSPAPPSYAYTQSHDDTEPSRPSAQPMPHARSEPAVSNSDSRYKPQEKKKEYKDPLTNLIFGGKKDKSKQ